MADLFRNNSLKIIFYLLVQSFFLVGCSSSNNADTPLACLDENPEPGCFTDADNDGLMSQDEIAGWEVWTDRYGYGEVTFTHYTVSSNYLLADTDGDGLSDYDEFLNKTDPTLIDTDGDGLSDADEIQRWLTSPTSVDTDGDARGPDHNLPPNRLLYDGNELAQGLFNPYRTSPTLADTDGDGRTDYEEIDHPTRSPLIADIPQLDIEIVDSVDIRLDVEYAEEEGASTQYGNESTDSNTRTVGAHNEWTLGAGIEYGIEGEASASLFNWGKVKSSVKISGTFQASWGFSTENSHSLQTAYSKYQTDSRTRTETTSSGSMTMGIQLKNTGDITYSISQLGLTVRQWQPAEWPGDALSLKTLATLTPHLDGNFTLAPGASSPVIQVEATEVNAARIKELLKKPNSLFIDGAYFELENSDGLNFDFFEEITGPRTARVVIDFGKGYSKEYRIATNVDRNDDASLAGITLGKVMSDLLELDYSTRNRQDIYPSAGSNERVLDSIWNDNTEEETKTSDDPARGFWTIAMRTDREFPEALNFDDIVLQGGEELLIAYLQDEDADGLLSNEEQYYGTADSNDDIKYVSGVIPVDSDGDGLHDEEEVRDPNCINPQDETVSCSWVVTLSDGSQYAVISDPKTADQDNDGLNDFEEKAGLTDPANSDTDQDGLNDGDDPYPLIPAVVRYVDTNAPGTNSGTSWQDAYTDLQAALANANSVNTDAIKENDVSEIWVAEGTYTPAAAGNRTVSFSLIKNVGIYGGFIGGEDKRAQRNINPIINNTILSGDLNADDNTSDSTTLSDNSYHVVVARGEPTNEITSASVLDGFTITAGNADWSAPDIDRNGAGILVSAATPTLLNLFVRSNNATGSGGGLFIENTRGIEITDSVFSDNFANGENAFNIAGGGIFYARTIAYTSEDNNQNVDADLIIKGCQFNANRSIQNGAAIAIFTDVDTGLLHTSLIKETTFEANEPPSGGPTVYLSGGHHTIDKSKFRGNNGFYDYEYTLRSAGTDTKLLVTQSEFWNNIGGGIYSESRFFYLINSTVVGNTGYGVGVADLNGAEVQNSILWGNGILSPTYGDYLNIRLKSTCIDIDPLFINESRGNLHLMESSPCIDRGNNFVDFNPFAAGFQLLPATDLDGRVRVIDGDGDGNSVVDMGSYEYR